VTLPYSSAWSWGSAIVAVLVGTVYNRTCTQTSQTVKTSISFRGHMQFTVWRVKYSWNEQWKVREPFLTYSDTNLSQLFVTKIFLSTFINIQNIVAKLIFWRICIIVKKCRANHYTFLLVLKKIRYLSTPIVVITYYEAKNEEQHSRGLPVPKT